LDVQGSSSDRAAPVALGELVQTGPFSWTCPALEVVTGGRESRLLVVLKSKAAPKANPGRFRLSATTFVDLDMLAALQAAGQGPGLTARTVLAAAELVNGDPGKAIGFLAHAVEQSSGTTVTDELLLFLAHQRLGETDKAGRILRRAMDRIEKDRPDGEFVLRILVKVLTQGLETSPGDMQMMNLRARSLEWLGRHAPAR
jgi:hypothetical protein